VKTARYKKVVDELADAIRGGKLEAGTRLPTHRRLAETNGLALATASRVYAELEAMGLVTGEIGRGTFVRDMSFPPDLSSDLHLSGTGTIELNYNYPSVPGQAAMLRDGLRRLAASGDLESMLHYQPHAGRAHERDIVARHLRDRALTVTGSQIAIVDGAQHGLAVTLMSLLRPGEVVAVDALTYAGFKILAEMLGLELAPVRHGEDGMDIDELRRLCAVRHVRAVYVMPTMHNPLGSVMSGVARQNLVEAAREHDLLIVEDAAYAFLVPNAPEPVAAMAPERTIYVSSLSKSVATGLRFGFVAAHERFIGLFERAIRSTTSNTPGVITSLACAWINDGTVAELEKQKRLDAQRRQAIVDDVMSGLPIVRNPFSYFVWLPLGEDGRNDRVAATLAGRGISVSTAEPFATTAHVPRAIRLALGSVSLETLKQALYRVRQVVEEDGLV
jgi:DNA-binding transcriptional MocR family regulator